MLTRQISICSAVFSFALLALLLTLRPGAVWARQASASINGTLTDPSGTVIEGADVALTSVATGITRTATSNSTGNYVFVDVLPGAYTMKVVKPGFESVVQQQFTLNVNQTATFDFHLTVGSTQQSVTVEAAAVAIQASTAELGTVINELILQDYHAELMQYNLLKNSVYSGLCHR